MLYIIIEVNKMKRYKYLIFDLDDTLLDFQDTERRPLKSFLTSMKFHFLMNQLNNINL